jgi:hypothetical protein
MGKRSNKPRIDKDAYQTIDPRAFPPILPHVQMVRAYAEPCAGERRLIGHLDEQAPWMECGYANDIDLGEDALTGEALAAARERYDVILTNPPWSRKILHPMIAKFSAIAPTWLLFDADWAHTVQSAKLMKNCVKIVSVGRLRWIPGTTTSGKDNAAWYLFDAAHEDGPRFYGRAEK